MRLRFIGVTAEVGEGDVAPHREPAHDHAIDAGPVQRRVGVVVEASHSCMTIRGVRKPGSLCLTSAMKGIFRSHLSSRSELMQLIYGERR